jgi:hypothetical protein
MSGWRATDLAGEDGIFAAAGRILANKSLRHRTAPPLGYFMRLYLLRHREAD